jgi:hypothetical protein
MASKERTQEILKALHDAVVAYDEKANAYFSPGFWQIRGLC